MLQGAGQVVGHAEEVAGEGLDGVGSGVVDLALGAAAGVLRLGGVAQGLVLQRGGFGAQGGDGVPLLGRGVLVGARAGFEVVAVGFRIIIFHRQVAHPSMIRPRARAVSSTRGITRA